MSSEQDERKRKSPDFWPMLLTPVDKECGLKPIHIDKDTFEIGSNAANDGVILHKSIAQKHCILKLTNKGNWELQQSTFGVTKINGSEVWVSRPRELNIGDKVQFGTGFEFLYAFEPAFKSGADACKKQRFSDAVYIPIRFGPDVKTTSVRVKIEPPDRRSILEAHEENKENVEDESRKVQISMLQKQLESGILVKKALEEENRLLSESLNAQTREFETWLKENSNKLTEMLNKQKLEFEVQLNEKLNAQKQKFETQLKIQENQFKKQVKNARASEAKAVYNSNMQVTYAIYASLYDCVKCSICFELFIKSVTLDCGHTFCSYCIKDRLKTIKTCPVCGEHIRTMARTFTLDIVINQLLKDVEENYANHRMVLIEERERFEVDCNKGVVTRMGTWGQQRGRGCQMRGWERERGLERWRGFDGRSRFRGDCMYKSYK